MADALTQNTTLQATFVDLLNVDARDVLAEAIRQRSAPSHGDDKAGNVLLLPYIWACRADACGCARPALRKQRAGPWRSLSTDMHNSLTIVHKLQ